MTTTATPDLFSDVKERNLTKSEEQKIDKVGLEVKGLSDQQNTLELRQKLSNFNTILSRNPLMKMVKSQQAYDYLPIRYYERLMRQLFFGRVKYEIIHFCNIFNEMVVHTRVHYFHPVTMEWQFVDGIAAHQIIQDKDTKVSDFHLYKKPNALKTVLPACYSESIKNACKKLGTIFGGDLNRKYDDDYDVFSHKSIPLNK